MDHSFVLQSKQRWKCLVLVRIKLNPYRNYHDGLQNHFECLQTNILMIDIAGRIRDVPNEKPAALIILT
jgi:hypothetical protein